MTIAGMMFVVISVGTGLLESPLNGHTNMDTKTRGHGSTTYCFLACKIREGELKYRRHLASSPTWAVLQLN